jgi:hypothetical protein
MEEGYGEIGEKQRLGGVFLYILEEDLRLLDQDHTP